MKKKRVIVEDDEEIVNTFRALLIAQGTTVSSWLRERIRGLVEKELGK